MDALLGWKGQILKIKMKNKKSIFFLLILLVVSLVSAEEGCYLHKESMFYCFDLEREEALGNCMIYEDCEFKEVFFSTRSCGDLRIFPECREVFCKSTCDYEPLGKCLGGEVLAGQEPIWCSPGCCRFEYYGGEFCESKTSKWLCEIEARNKYAGKFNFEIMDESRCQEACAQAPIVGARITEDLVTEGLVLETEAGKSPPPTPAIISEEGSKGWIWIFLVLIFLSIALFLLYQRHKPKKEKTVKKPKIKRKPRFFIRKKAIKEREERIRKLKEEIEKKRKERETKELFELFDLGGVREKKLTHVDLLKKIIKLHELKDRKRLREEEIFRKAEKFVKRLKEKEKFTEKEAEDIFERLRKIVEKK